TNPLLQSWYAHGGVSGDKAVAAPPYRLYALSNFGSLLALLTYPVLIEPNFSLRTQTLAWSVGFLVFVVVCGVIASRREAREIPGPESQPERQPLPAVSGAAATASPTATAAAPSLVPET